MTAPFREQSARTSAVHVSLSSDSIVKQRSLSNSVVKFCLGSHLRSTRFTPDQLVWCGTPEKLKKNRVRPAASNAATPFRWVAYRACLTSLSTRHSQKSSTFLPSRDNPNENAIIAVRKDFAFPSAIRVERRPSPDNRARWPSQPLPPSASSAAGS